MSVYQWISLMERSRRGSGEPSARQMRRRRRRQLVGDWPLPVAAVVLWVVGWLLLGLPGWLLWLIVLTPVVAFGIPATRRRMVRRHRARADKRAWMGDEVTPGIVHGVGLTSAGQCPAIVDYRWLDSHSGDRAITFALVPGLTDADFRDVLPHLTQSFGAAYGAVELAGLRHVTITLRDAHPLAAEGDTAEWVTADEPVRDESYWLDRIYRAAARDIGARGYGDRAEPGDDDASSTGQRPWWDTVGRADDAAGGIAPERGDDEGR